MKKTIFILVTAVLLLSTFVSAVDCSFSSDEAYCLEILNSDLNETEKDLMLSTLLYQENTFPDHEFIEDYNLNLYVDSPPDNITYSSTQIKNAWLSFLAVFPSVYENDTLYVSEELKALSEYDYNVQIPTETKPNDCQTDYTLVNDNAQLNYYLNNNYKEDDKYALLYIDQDGTLTAELEINTNVKVDHYEWHYYCCSWGSKGQCTHYCKTCEYAYTDYESDNLVISEDKEIELYTEQPTADLTIVNEYHNTTKGIFTAEGYSFFRLSFEDSYLTKQNYYYDLVFEKKPYYFVYLRATSYEDTKIKNLFVNNDKFFVKNTNNCSLEAYNHFYNFTSDCDLTLYQENIEELSIDTEDIDLSILLYVLIFLGVMYIIYRLLKSQYGKIVLPLLFLILFIPFVSADDPEECGLTNLGSCLPEVVYEYFLYLINLPVLPFLLLIESLLTADIAIDLFYGVWNVVRYILSFFYVFLLIYVGYVFLTSNANPIKRAHAKDMLKNIFLMLILIQGSFYIYSLALDINTALNNVILSMIDPQFFLITVDNVSNIALEGVYLFTYCFTLFITLLMLVFRYVFVCLGVIIFPIGLFCYFIPPLKGYGKFIINALAIFIFITFFDLLIVLCCSMIVEIPLFENIKIIVMIICFAMIIYSMWLAIRFAMRMSTNSSLKDDLNQAVKYIAMVAV
jgi:hypothetical protein